MANPEMKGSSRVKYLVKYLNDCRAAYYNSNISPISDKEYDQLFDELERLEKETGLIYSDSPTQTVGYEVVSKLVKVTHNHELLSLAKTTDLADFIHYFAGNPLCLMAKMDGLTASLCYEKGELVRAESRGDGKVGEDITHSILTFSNVPKVLPVKEDFIIDGECIIDYGEFEKIKEAESVDYRNPRNLVSGTVRQLDSSVCARRHPKFIAWKLYKEGSQEYGPHVRLFDQSLDYLKQLGFDVAPHVLIKDYITKEDSFFAAEIEQIKKQCETLLYPIDGMVGAFNDIQYGRVLGFTSHHPKHSLAFKFYQERNETILRDVEWETSRTGRVNPVAIFDPVEIDGTEVSRATLSNLSVIEDLQLGIGDTVLVIKANQIIPQITENLTKSNNLSIPTTCPSCGSPLIIKNLTGRKTLLCTNDQCFAKLQDTLTFFCSNKAMDIEGLSEETISTLINEGLLTCRIDIYRLHKQRKKLEQLEGFGKVKVDKLLSSIEKSKHTTFEKFITAFGIPNVGPQTSKQILDFLKSKLSSNNRDYVSDFISMADGLFEWSCIDGIGKKMEGEINLFVNRHFDEMVALRSIMSMEDEKSEPKTSSTLTGKTFCITGKLIKFSNRKELESCIVNMGGVIHSTVKKDTDYLITNDVDSGSAKNKLAQKFGTKIISEADFCELISK